jgi:CubicO group peptidase (beta-lactamase class C family)
MKKLIGILVTLIITLSFEIKGNNVIVVTGSFPTSTEKEIILSSTYPENPLILAISINDNGSFILKFTAEAPAYYKLNADITLDLFLIPGDSVFITEFNDTYVFSGGESSILCNYFQDTVWQNSILSHKEVNDYFSLEPEDFYQTDIDRIISCQVPLNKLKMKFSGLNNEFIRLENERQKYRWLRDIYAYELLTGRDTLDRSYYDRVLKDVDLNDNSLLQIDYYQDFLLKHLNYYSNRYLKENPANNNLHANVLETKLKIIDSLYTNSSIIDFLYYKTFLNSGLNSATLNKFKSLNNNEYYLKQLEKRLANIYDQHKALDSINNLTSSVYQICYEKFEDIIQKYVAKYEFMGTVLLAKDDSIIHLKSYGFTNIDKKIPNATNTNYVLASVTKLFTRAAIIMLKDKGLLALEDPLSKYIPDYPSGDIITIKHLMEHKSGIVDYRNELLLLNDETHYVNIEEVIDGFKYRPLNFEPGTKRSYSNSGYVLLAYIIEKASGKKYNDFIENNIFNVLNMNNSYASWDVEPENRAVGYVKGDGGLFIPCEKIHTSNIIGTGNLSSSAEDMFKWYKGIYGTHQISSEFQLSGTDAQTGRGSCCMSSAFGIVQQQDFVTIILSNYKDTPISNMLRDFLTALQKK